MFLTMNILSMFDMIIQVKDLIDNDADSSSYRNAFDPHPRVSSTGMKIMPSNFPSSKFLYSIHGSVRGFRIPRDSK